MRQQKTRTIFILTLILGLGGFIRLYKLGELPISLYWEEAALGYDAFSILKTGKDYHGNSWPIVAFESFGDYKPTGYFYGLIPFIGFFGLSETVVRLPSALAGIFTLGLVYLVGKELFKRETPALAATFALTVMPWHIQFSRAAFEVNLATFFLVLGIWLFILSRKKHLLFLGAVIAMVFSMYTYHGLRLLAPMITILCLVHWRQQYRKMRKTILTGAILGIILVWPQIAAFNSPQIRQRFNETSLFSTSQAVFKQNEWRQEDNYTILSRLVHHRNLIMITEIINGIVNHFSPRFLWSEGDGNQRHQTGYFGLLNWWSIIPLFFLVYKSQKGKDLKVMGFLLVWVLLAAIPPALTNTTPHTLRFLPAAPAMAMLIGLGIEKGYDFIKQKSIYGVWLGCFISVMVIELGIFSYDYIYGYPRRSGHDWQYGYAQMVKYINQPFLADLPVQITRYYGRPSIYVLFYTQAEPALIQAAEPTLARDQGELLNFGRYRFGEIKPNQSGLAVSEVALNFGRLLTHIDDLNQKPIFYIYDLR